MRSQVVSALLAAAVLAACGSPPGTLFHATLANVDGAYPLPVTLGDTTGLVVGIGAATVEPGDFRDAGVLADPSAPRAFILTWLGGACENDEAVAFRRTDSGFDLHLTVHDKLGLGGCPALGVLRALRIETSEPIATSAITISGDKKIELVLDEDCGFLRAAATNDAKVACYALIDATIGEQRDTFARVAVAPDDGACPGTECSTAEGIAAQPWRVEAMDRMGQSHTWRCTYANQAASCTGR